MDSAFLKYACYILDAIRHRQVLWRLREALCRLREALWEVLKQELGGQMVNGLALRQKFFILPWENL